MRVGIIECHLKHDVPLCGVSDLGCSCIAVLVQSHFSHTEVVLSHI